MTPIEEWHGTDAGRFAAEVRPLYRPVVLRGIARDWPLFEAGQAGPLEALARIAAFDSGKPCAIMAAPPEAGGRFFYDQAVTGFNFERRSGTLTQLAETLAALREEPAPPALYVSAAATAEHLPGFDAAHPLPLLAGEDDAISRLWIGNRTEVATHFDLSDNIAVVVQGLRRFTLFPPDCIADLYIGPLDVTLAGQPVSMVDPLRPDPHRYPRFAAAAAQALYADLAPGDAIYVPTLWWHHVAARDAINVMVNYWHRDARAGGGFLALIHAMMAIRDQPEPLKAAWRSWFDHLVFDRDAASAADHLPAAARGVHGPASPQRDARIRRYISEVLSR